MLRWLADADGTWSSLVVEDVQWADDATLDLLRFLGRRLRDLPVLLVVTFRDDALAPADTAAGRPRRARRVSATPAGSTCRR